MTYVHRYHEYARHKVIMTSLTFPLTTIVATDSKLFITLLNQSCFIQRVNLRVDNRIFGDYCNMGFVKRFRKMTRSVTCCFGKVFMSLSLPFSVNYRGFYFFSTCSERHIKKYMYMPLTSYPNSSIYTSKTKFVHLVPANIFA